MNQAFEGMHVLHMHNGKESMCKYYLHFMEFEYNSKHPASMGNISFETLYGRIYSTLVRWDNLVNTIVLGPKFVKEMD